MAHKSHKKHIKHTHQQEPATPKAKSPVAKAEVAQARIAKDRTRASGTKKRAKALAGDATAKKPGLVRKIARAATAKVAEKVTGKPKKIISKAKARVQGAKARVEARVKSLLGAA